MRQTSAVSTEDGVLIARAKQGEAEAFDRLMALHMDKIYALAWGVLMNREDAMDAVQEVFIKLYWALPKFPPDNNLSAWLYRVCLNHCIDRKRRKKRAATTDSPRRAAANCITPQALPTAIAVVWFLAKKSCSITTTSGVYWSKTALTCS